MLVKAWLQHQDASALKTKNDALEQAAQRAREEEQAKNAAEAKDIVARDDRDAAIDFLRDSFSKVHASAVPGKP